MRFDELGKKLTFSTVDRISDTGGGANESEGEAPIGKDKSGANNGAEGEDTDTDASGATNESEGMRTSGHRTGAGPGFSKIMFGSLRISCSARG